MEDKAALNLVIRYALILLLTLGNFFVFYAVFAPLTVYTVYFILKLFNPETILLNPNPFFLNLSDLSLTFPLIRYSSIALEIIPACIAGSAYFVLTALNLSLPLTIKKRLYNLLFLLGMFLLANIIRIIVLANLSLSSTYFDVVHNFTWHFGSTIFLVITWFVGIKLFKIKAIPVYTDLKGLYLDARKPKR
jgi:exosortase/archaeosortase family protein